MRWIAAAVVGVATMLAGCRKQYQAEAMLIGDARYMISLITARGVPC